MTCRYCGATSANFERYFNVVKEMEEQYCTICRGQAAVISHLHISKERKHRRYRQFNASECDLCMPFSLTAEQQLCSNSLIKMLKSKNYKRILLHAICGAGKTEIIAVTIFRALQEGKRIGWAIARRDVVIELAERLVAYFPKTKIVALYQDSPDLSKIGQLTVLTTARLLQFRGKFDYLIVDENDAYPFNVDKYQQFAADHTISKKGKIIHVSATILKGQKTTYDGITTLARRYHQVDLPSVSFIKISKFQFEHQKKFSPKLLSIFKKYKCEDKPVFVFVPTKRFLPLAVQALLSVFSPHEVASVSSDVSERTSIIEAVRKGEKKCLVTTTILERGVTFDNVQVIVLFAEHEIFDAQTLIQISGRVGRTISHPTGEIIFLYFKNVTRPMLKARKYHQRSNKGEILFL